MWPIATTATVTAPPLATALTTRRIKAGTDWIVSPVAPDVASNVRSHRHLPHRSVFCHPVALSPCHALLREPNSRDSSRLVDWQVRDGLSKAMYQRVFSWMVMRVNANLAILQQVIALSSVDHGQSSQGSRSDSDNARAEGSG